MISMLNESKKKKQNVMCNVFHSKFHNIEKLLNNWNLLANIGIKCYLLEVAALAISTWIKVQIKHIDLMYKVLLK